MVRSLLGANATILSWHLNLLKPSEMISKIRTRDAIHTSVLGAILALIAPYAAAGYVSIGADEVMRLSFLNNKFIDASVTREIKESVIVDTGETSIRTFFFDSPVVSGSVKVNSSPQFSVSNVIVTPTQVSYEVKSLSSDPGEITLEFTRKASNDAIYVGESDGLYTLTTGNNTGIGGGAIFPFNFQLAIPGDWSNAGTTTGSHLVRRLNPSWSVSNDFTFDGTNTIFQASNTSYSSTLEERANFSFRLYGAATTPDLPPSLSLAPTRGLATPIGIAFGTDGKLLDPTLPLIVITHGWQAIGSEIPEWIGEMGFAARGATDPKANILLWSWEDAFTPSLGTATAAVSAQGKQLGAELLSLGITSETPIQFIGHSLGTLVNAYATDLLTASKKFVSQFTILDRPFGQTGGSLLSTDIDAGPNADEIIFQTLLKRDAVKYVDNYYGDGFSSTGAKFDRATSFNWLYRGAGHSDVHEIYDATISSSIDCNAITGGFGCSASKGGPTYWPTWDPGTVSKTTSKLGLDPIDWLNLRCDEAEGVVTCAEGSPAYFWNPAIEIPTWAQYLSFDFKWLDPGDGDWFSVFFDNQLLFSMLGQDLGEDFFNSGLLPISMFAGDTGQLLFALNSVGGANARFAFTNVEFTGVVSEPHIVLLLFLAWMALLVSRNRSKSLR